MSRGALLVALASLGAACGLGRDFKVTGTVTIAGHLRHKFQKETSVLFIVAKNRGGVPLAVRRIVSPQFPVAFTLGPEDLVVPGSRPREALHVEVQMNTHGAVGKPQKGDLGGASDDPVYPGMLSVHIEIDRQL